MMKNAVAFKSSTQGRLIIAIIQVYLLGVAKTGKAQVIFSDDWCGGWKWWIMKSRKSIHHFNLRNKNDAAHREQYISTEALVMQIWHFKTVSWLILPISFPMVSITTKFPQLSQRLSSKHSHWINQPCSVPPFAAPLSFCCGQDSNCGINRFSNLSFSQKFEDCKDLLFMFSPFFGVSRSPVGHTFASCGAKKWANLVCRWGLGFSSAMEFVTYPILRSEKSPNGQYPQMIHTFTRFFCVFLLL